MKRGHLSEYFSGVGAKRLTAVEVDAQRSHQHEFQGVESFRTLLGSARRKLDTRLVYLSDDTDPTLVDGSLSWYDAREQQTHRSAEYHLYYSSNLGSTVSLARPGDLVVLALTRDETVLVIIAPVASTAEAQLFWLFDLPDDVGPAIVKSVDDVDREVSLAAEQILQAVGIEVPRYDETFLDLMLDRFGGDFPSTVTFSAFARETLDAIGDPDEAVTRFMEREELLFKTLERHIVTARLTAGFADSDALIAFSLSLHQRRRSRAGRALENHLEAIFDSKSVTFSRGQITENNERPDFIFPSIQHYHDAEFPPGSLSMLASKQTSKDRWRQILQEAARISEKHLFTLQPSISKNQTDQMSSASVTLVVPSSVQETYLPSQRDDLLSVAEFISLVRERQAAV
jgi:hypothetical protein